MVHISTYDSGGGAARSARRLHEGLLAIGCDSKMFVKKSGYRGPDTVVFRPRSEFGTRLKRYLRRRKIRGELGAYRNSIPPGYEEFHHCSSEFGGELIAQIPECDIVNLHWIVGGFVDLRALIEGIAARVPIVWTLHDMHPFTGGCHYDSDCNGYETGCGNCPQLGSSKRTDLSARIVQSRVKAFASLEKKKFRFVSPSRWLHDRLLSSRVARGIAASVIPYGLPLGIFAPRDRFVARELLDLPLDANVILFIADGVNNPRKGFEHLRKALMEGGEIVGGHLLSFGRSRPEADFNFPWTHLEFTGNDRLLSFAYSAADLVVVPSLQDNLPNTALEAMACGTPVVGFQTGGIPDLVRSGVTGVLVPTGDAGKLGDAIRSLFENRGKLSDMRASCRRTAEAEYDARLQATRYLQLYTEMLQGRACSQNGSEPLEIACTGSEGGRRRSFAT